MDHGREAVASEYAHVVWTHKLLIASIVVVAVGASLALSFSEEPTYRSEAEVLVSQPETTPTGAGLPPASIASMMQTEASVATSADVAKTAADVIGGDQSGELLDDIEVTPVPDTQILVFEATAPSPRRASRIAQAFADAYLDNRREESVNYLLSTSDILLEQIDELNARIAEFNEEIASTEDEATRATLTAQVSSTETQIAFLREKLVEATPVNFQAGKVLRPAEPPADPSSPRPMRAALLALIAGLGIGVAAAFVADRVEDRLRGRGDLENTVRAPVLAVVPRVTARSRRVGLVTEVDPGGAAAEAYRTLRTALLLAEARQGVRTVTVTSSDRGEGKSTTVANLGLSLSQAGKKVIVVSGDLRMPRLHELFGVSEEPGLTNVLARQLPASEALVAVGRTTQNLRLLPSGPTPVNPAELLGSEGMRNLLRFLRGASDFVLIDAPPVLSVSDTTVLSTITDSVLLVADAGRVTREALLETRLRLQSVDVRVLGAVLNRSDRSSLVVPGYVAEAPEQSEREERLG